MRQPAQRKPPDIDIGLARYRHQQCASRPGPTCDVGWLAHPPHEPPNRPLRLFETPERIKVGFALVPDGPPTSFSWRQLTHRVIRAEGPERIAMEWWRADGKTLTRDYFRVEDDMGLRFWLFREGLFGRELVQPHWFLHGLFA